MKQAYPSDGLFQLKYLLPPLTKVVQHELELRTQRNYVASGVWPYFVTFFAAIAWRKPQLDLQTPAWYSIG